MTSFIRDAFSDFDIQLTPQHAKALHMFVLQFEMRADHALVLNSQSLAIRRVSFLPSDRRAVFNMFGLDEEDVQSVIDKIPSIDKDRLVSSDPLSLLCIWVAHLAHINRALPKDLKLLIKFNVCKILNYRFFTSLSSHVFKYLADEATMLATISQLTNKYDIITLGTWKAVIDARCHDIIDPDSIHYKTIERMDDDKNILYIITDTRSRIADRIKNVAKVYYETHKSGIAISSYSNIKEIDGQKIIADQVAMFDVMISNLTREVLNTNLFYEQQKVRLVADFFDTLSADKLRTAIIALSERAIDQYKSGDAFDEVRTINHREVIIGIRKLITHIVQKTYRKLIYDGIPINAKAIVINARNIYSASRISDPDMLQIKESLTYFVDSIGTTKREATRASLRIAIILYILIKSMAYI